jgi:glycerol-3-phosphate acyltransferase PlsY
VAFATFLGHLYPIFFGFHGGKGVATFIGVLLGLAWPLGVLYIVAWMLVAKVGRVSSLAALIAAALTPVAALLMHQPAAVLAAIVAMVLLLFWRHRANIRRIVAGSESRIDDKEAGASDSIES